MSLCGLFSFKIPYSYINLLRGSRHSLCLRCSPCVEVKARRSQLCAREKKDRVSVERRLPMLRHWFICISYSRVTSILWQMETGTFVSRNKRVFCLFFCVCVCLLSFDLFCLFLALNCNLFLLGLYGKDIGVSWVSSLFLAGLSGE